MVSRSKIADNMPPDKALASPTDRKKRGIWVVLSFAVMLAVLLPGAVQHVGPADEGFSVYNSMRVLSGEVIYRDFFAMYAPGIFWTMAGLFQFFGQSLAVERILDLLMRFGILTLLYTLIRRSASRLVALIPTVVCCLLLATADNARGYAMFPALAFSLLSCHLLLRFVDSGNRLLLLGSGICVGLAGFYRHDVGFYSFLAASFTLFLSAPLSNANSAPAFSLPRKQYPVFVMGLGVVAIPVCLYFLLNGALKDVWYCLVVVPGTFLHAVRALPLSPIMPLGSGHWWVLAIRLHSFGPLAVYLLAAILLAHRMWKQGRWLLRQRAEQTLFLMIALGALLFAQTWSRNDFVHRIPTSLFALAVITIVICEFRPPIGWVVVKSVALAGVLVFLVMFSARHLKSQWLNHLAWIRSGPCQHSLPRASCLSMDTDQVQAIRYVQSNVPENERIFVGLPQHQRVYTGDLMFYFLSNRHSGVRFQEMLPNMTNTAPVQKSMIDDLIRSKVRCVVLFSGYEHVREPNLSSVASGVHLFDDYIRSQYHVVAQFGVYTILMNR
jgi:hypothetical protein